MSCLLFPIIFQNPAVGISAESSSARGGMPDRKPGAKQSRTSVLSFPQRDETIEEIKRLDALLEYAVMHGDEAEAARLRAELAKLVEKV